MPQNKTTADTLQAILWRLTSWLRYYSGQLGARRRAARRQGDVPWRILRYQRVIHPSTEPYPVPPEQFVLPETFETHMLYLSKKCYPIALEELVRRIEANETIPEKAVAVTFDHGWQDTYKNAFPVLRNLKIPATVFLATAFTDTMNLFWQDKVLAGMLLLEQVGVDFPPLPFFPKPTNAGDVKQNFAYSMTRILHLIDYLSKTSIEERTTCLVALTKGLAQIGGLPMERKFISWDEINEMQRLGINFGTNSHSHRLFSEMDAAQIDADICQSLQTLAAHNIKASTVFCYPEGNITKESRDVVFKHGFSYGASIGKFPKPNPGKATAQILGRISIFESISYAVDLFAGRIWGQ